MATKPKAPSKRRRKRPTTPKEDTSLRDALDAIDAVNRMLELRGIDDQYELILDNGEEADLESALTSTK